MYHFFETHDKYPTEKLIYLGNRIEIEHPKNEFVPENSLFYRYMGWWDFESNICDRYIFWKEYFKRQE